jgi:catechol 2,3-dioxygenase-like lactoylglutathione lyase family enzyme
MMPLTLDHLVIAVRDLDAATNNYRRVLGLRPSWRGRHPTYGTANVLFRLEDNTYIELLAPDAGAAPSDWSRGLHDFLARGEGLYAIALGCDDIDAAVARARAAGLRVLDPADGEGVDLDTGARRAWRNARIDPSSTRGVRAFFIEHRSPPDALPLAQPEPPGGSHVTGVDHTVLVSSQLDEALRVWRDAIGLDLRRTVDWSPERRLHFLRLGTSILELAGPAELKGGGVASTPDPRPSTPGVGQGRDVFWGISYRVDDVARTVERLRALDVAVSDARNGRADGTAVADLKPGFSHDVRTLFIEKML